MKSGSYADDEFRSEPDLDALRRAYALIQSDPAKAMGELEDLAKRNSAMSMIYLGDMFERGTGTAIDLEKAEDWFSKASLSGSVEGAFRLGMLYLLRNNKEKAEDVFRSEILKEFPPALDRLGSLYVERGDAESIEQARLLFETADALGNIYAKRHLAGLMITGRLGISRILPGFWLLARSVKTGFSLAVSDPGSDRIR
ncbi:tetratricopeptide repeat protein [Mesorhizobium sp. Cs1299R1N1]|uniref:tetratricopeptide repeat protein n=1 Tax=Mesorhizobium sp. Cs1299R1N1 TaxID=3015172 RepID=UPI00301C5B2D